MYAETITESTVSRLALNGGSNLSVKHNELISEQTTTDTEDDKDG